jgi:DNA polymerase-1
VTLDRFGEVWAVDTEFHRPPGWLPSPVCCVAAVEVKSGREIKLWTEHGSPLPFDTGPGSLFVAHYSSAEWLAFRILGWHPPINIIDTYVEARCLTNGLPGRKDGKKAGEGQQRKCGLLDLAKRYGFNTMTEARKAAGRDLAMRGGPWTEAEQAEMLEYCLDDARTCRDVFLTMLPEVTAPKHGLAQALLRGRVMRACASIEHVGVPVDLELLRSFEANWPAIRRALIEATDPGRYDSFEGDTFKRRRFEALLDRLNIRHWRAPRPASRPSRIGCGASRSLFTKNSAIFTSCTLRCSR